MVMLRMAKMRFDPRLIGVETEQLRNQSEMLMEGIQRQWMTATEAVRSRNSRHASSNRCFNKLLLVLETICRSCHARIRSDKGHLKLQLNCSQFEHALLTASASAAWYGGDGSHGACERRIGSVATLPTALLPSYTDGQTPLLPSGQSSTMYWTFLLAAYST